MTDKQIAELAPMLAIVALIAGIAWNKLGVPNWGEIKAAQLPRDDDGAWIVPVSQIIYRRRWGGTTNGISPDLRITAAGLRFKVFQRGEKRFGDFRRVDASRSVVHGTCLSFVGRGEQLHAIIRDRAAARAVLRLLPPELTLTRAAAALRGSC